MDKIFSKLQAIGIIPVVILNDAKNALPLAHALYSAGLKCAEITFRTNAAEESIRIICKAFPDMLIGAGTVLTTDQADCAIDAGAAFIVSPGLNPCLVKHCQNKGVPIAPGIATPSELEQAIALGLDTVKFFPAEPIGGVQTIKAISAPYPHIHFIPSGGINAGNLTKYLSFPKIIACGGSWMVPEHFIDVGDFDEISRLSKEAVLTMLGFETSYIAIHAKELSNPFEQSLGISAGEHIRFISPKSNDSQNYLAVLTNDIKRAAYYLEIWHVVFSRLPDMPDAIELGEKINDLTVRIIQK